MKQIFVGGAFFTTDKEHTDIFPYITNIIKKEINNVKVMQPLDIEVYREEYKKNNPNCTLEELNKVMVDYDLEMIKTSSLMIADITNKSLGLGIELGIIKINNIPLELVARKNAQISNMVFGAFPKCKISYYESLQELESIIKRIIQKYI